MKTKKDLFNFRLLISRFLLSCPIQVQTSDWSPCWWKSLVWRVWEVLLTRYEASVQNLVLMLQVLGGCRFDSHELCVCVCVCR